MGARTPADRHRRQTRRRAALFWLLALADEVPALVLGIIIAVVDMAAFGEFLISVQSIPALLTPQPLCLYAAALTSLLAALLMLTQRSLKRLLVLSTVEDVGFLLLGAASASALGQDGAIIAAASHALAKALLVYLSRRARGRWRTRQSSP